MKPSSTKKILITAVITFIATSVVWLGVGIALYKYWTEAPPPFNVTITHPDTVKLRDTFFLEIEVENTSSKSASLGSIDLYDELLDGFTVLSVEPEPNAKEHRWGFATYYLKRSISPDESFTFTLELQADQLGYWSGDIDSCTPFESFVTADASIEVID